MITRSHGKKDKRNTEEKQNTAENEYLENKINETVRRMKEFGIQHCCKCGTEVEHNRYAAKGTGNGYKYYCIPCDNRRG